MEKTPLVCKQYLTTYIFVTSLFMLWGIALSMGDVLNRHFQKVLHVSLAQSGLVQFSLFGAYAVMGLPAGWLMKKYGYKNGVLVGLLLYAAGAFLFIPAASAESCSFFLVSVLVLDSYSASKINKLLRSPNASRHQNCNIIALPLLLKF